MSLAGHKFILARGEGSINSNTPLLDSELIEIEKPDEEGGSITNITQIANRSYNDLQELPWGTNHKTGTSQSLLLSDKNKIILSATNDNLLIIPSGVFNAGDRVVIYNAKNETPISLDGSALEKFYATHGKTTTIKGAGRVEVYFNLPDNAVVTGDLVEEYAIRQSPNGNLWKVSVDNSGNEVITAL